MKCMVVRLLVPSAAFSIIACAGRADPPDAPLRVGQNEVVRPCGGDTSVAADGEPPYFGFQVDRQVEIAGGWPEPVPARENAEARVDVMFIVDTTGRVSLPTVRLVETTHRLDTEAVCAALAEARFTPAEREERPVRMWHRHVFRF